jgi:tyrosyl-tRNA synthetase
MTNKNLNVEERLKLIKRNTFEIIGEEKLKEILEKKEKPVVYWGTAPTGRPHVGYFFPALKIADLLKAGFHVKILLADLHAALDNVHWPALEKRYEYYSKIIPLMIQSIGVDTKELEFIKGSDFQLKPEYMFDVLQMSSNVSVRDSTKAASEVVKGLGEEGAKLSGLVYPLMQAVDEEYLKADAQLGGTDQRKIMVLARENLPKLNYESRIEIMHPLIPGLIGKKMSSSEGKSKIDLLNTEEEVKKKIKGADCVEGDPENGIMSFVKYVIMTIKADKGEKFVITRPEKYGGNLEYENYENLEKDFIDKKVHPLDLKTSVANEVSELLILINKNREELEKISQEAYSEGQ